jgi:Glucose-6-phosphate dehydrogenase, NAD binding domain
MIQRLAILGATGDLTARYLLPGLAALRAAGELGDDFRLVAVGRENWCDDVFRQRAAAQLERHAAELPTTVKHGGDHLALPPGRRHGSGQQATAEHRGRARSRSDQAAYRAQGRPAARHDGEGKGALKEAAAISMSCVNATKLYRQDDGSVLHPPDTAAASLWPPQPATSPLARQA